jgi:hypothetical protein
MKKYYLKHCGYLLEEGKGGDQKQDGKKVYSELGKNVVYKMETRKADFGGDWVSKKVAICHRTTTYKMLSSFKCRHSLAYIKVCMLVNGASHVVTVSGQILFDTVEEAHVIIR